MTRSRQLNGREWRLLLIAAGLAILLVFYLLLLLPAIRQFRDVRAKAQQTAEEYVQLQANIQARDRVEAAFAQLDSSVLQTESDEAAISAWLRELEALGRKPNLSILNMKPARVERNGSHNIYRVKLSIAGRLVDVLQFVSNSTHGKTVAGIDSFSLRSTGASNMVECSATFSMVKLLGEVARARTESSLSSGPLRTGEIQ